MYQSTMNAIQRVLKQAALNCAEIYFDHEETQGLPMLAATMVEFSIGSRTKKTNTMISENLMLRACVTQGVNVSREELAQRGRQTFRVLVPGIVPHPDSLRHLHLSPSLGGTTFGGHSSFRIGLHSMCIH